MGLAVRDIKAVSHAITESYDQWWEWRRGFEPVAEVRN
jgi:hypothetical protein